jgi:hypothetical protein
MKEDIEIDVVLREGETPEQVIEEIMRKTKAVAYLSAQQYSSSCTLRVSCYPGQIARVRKWHNADRKPRPGSEPPVSNEGDYPPEWFVWLRSHSTAELNKLADQWGQWRPSDNPEIDPDLIMEKWEAVCQELFNRASQGEQ